MESWLPPTSQSHAPRWSWLPSSASMTHPRPSIAPAECHATPTSDSALATSRARSPIAIEYPFLPHRSTSSFYLIVLPLRDRPAATGAHSCTAVGPAMPWACPWPKHAVLKTCRPRRRRRCHRRRRRRCHPWHRRQLFATPAAYTLQLDASASSPLIRARPTGVVSSVEAFTIAPATIET